MTIDFSLIVFLAAALSLLWLLRRDRISLGLPLAYMLALSLEHAPGAFVYFATGGSVGSPAVERGFYLAAVGAACFTVGVAITHTFIPYASRRRAVTANGAAQASSPSRAYGAPIDNGPRLWLFCLVGGWVTVYGLSAVLRLPSIGAVIEKGGAVWMLGVMLGLSIALRRRAYGQACLWFSALAIYPALMLLLGGFLSYGSAAVIIVCSLLTITARRYWKVIGVTALASFLAISIFVNYFAARTTIRNVVWSGASIDKRIDVVLGAFSNPHFFSINNYADVNALNQRLNQNYFAGVAANRLDDGYVDYMRGQSIIDGAIALVPRALWPEKPVYGGSPEVVRRMTGLDLNVNTSWGVGQVMEFYINFAMPGLVGGFLLLGGLMGWLDRKAAVALRTDPGGSVFLYFLPCVALIQPIGSLVELTGGFGAALGAGFAWRFVWNALRQKQAEQAQYSRLLARLNR